MGKSMNVVELADIGKPMLSSNVRRLLANERGFRRCEGGDLRILSGGAGTEKSAVF